MDHSSSDEDEEDEEQEEEEEEIVDTDLNVEVYKEQSSPKQSVDDDDKAKPRFAISHKLSRFYLI